MRGTRTFPQREHSAGSIDRAFSIRCPRVPIWIVRTCMAIRRDSRPLVCLSADRVEICDGWRGERVGGSRAPRRAPAEGATSTRGRFRHSARRSCSASRSWCGFLGCRRRTAGCLRAGSPCVQQSASRTHLRDILMVGGRWGERTGAPRQDSETDPAGRGVLRVKLWPIVPAVLEEWPESYNGGIRGVGSSSSRAAATSSPSCAARAPPRESGGSCRVHAGSADHIASWWESP